MFMLNNSVTSRISSPPTASVAVSIAIFTYTILAFILACTTSIFSNAFRSITPLFRSRCQAVTTIAQFSCFLLRGAISYWLGSREYTVVSATILERSLLIAVK